ncbi:hypothetical protein [Streptomyces lavendulae]|uniref:hypothetical protein n=1 Tax=Streptomyces lavendulae TaxID=1914 RepID=UPI0033F21514
MTGRRVVSKTQSWDAFWAEAAPRAEVEIRGVTLQVPADMPMGVEQRIQELQDSTELEDVAELVSLLFGTDCIAQWREAGMGLKEFQTVLTWGLARASGRDTTFAEALALVEQGAPAGKGPNRAARRSQSAATGGPSKPTSRASTGSARSRSRT